MLTNIVDRREHKYVWDHVTAIFEPTYHDNTVAEAYGPSTSAPAPERDWSYQELADCSVAEACARAQELDGHTTVFLYDLGRGIS